jgi:2-oxoglutarate dehydrogenase E2 component (dihydrolipoamide succinyltransferase)
VLIEVKVPRLAESVPDATLLTWHKQAGEHVTQGENLIDLETDKVTLEVPAPQNGVLKQLVRKTGETVLSDDVLAIIDTEAKASAAPPREVETSTVPAKAPPEQPKLSPAVRKLVAEHQLEPAALPATGKDGRITKGDVLTYLNPAAKPQEQPAAAPPSVKTTLAGTGRGERRVAMSRLRRTVAQRLLAAQQENAILTTFNEVNMQPVMALRQRHREEFEKRYGAKLGIMSFFAKAAVEALKRFPIVNASVDGIDIVHHDYYDLGIAVSSPRGLVVPVLRDADRLSFADIETKIREFGDKARDATLSIEELSGGTFTITNGGIFGSLLSTPIINPPQSAILGMHKIQERPVAEQGQVVIRPMMYLALSYDHRIIDGREAVSFLVAIKEQMEDPSRMLLQV